MKNWYYSDGVEKYGPFLLEELKNHPIDEKTLVWIEGMDDWKPAREVSEIAEVLNFDKSLPPPISSGDLRNKNVFEEDFLEEDRPMPKTYLVESILVTFCCCLPLGIVGIVFAAKVESSYRRDGYKIAKKNSEDALKWVKLAFWIGLVIRIIFFIVYFGFIAFMVNDAANFPGRYNY